VSSAAPRLYSFAIALEVYWLSSFFHAMEMQNDAWRQIADQTKAVIFLATPHRGSNLAAILGNVVSALGAIGALTRMTVSVKELEAKAPALQDLNVWYINNAGRVGIATHCFYEKQTVRGGLVVDEASGRLELPGADPIAIDADHFNICKPPSHEALIYRRIRQIVYETIATPDLPTPSSATWQSDTQTETHGRPATTSPAGPARIFLSYRRSARPDYQLAHFLRDGLQSAGHEVFIDTGMRVGTDWALEIQERINWCDYLIVLLSKDAVGSEMVVGEVRRAHHQQKRSGRPHLLPIRVRYDNELDYELDAYLGRLHYAKWDGDADSQKLLAEVRGMVDVAIGLPKASGVAQTDTGAIQPRPDQERPHYTCDPRLLRAPGGTARLRDPLYIRRAPDDEAEVAAGRTGETLVIKAPRQMGKSSLAVRYLAACRDKEKAVAYLDFQLLGEDNLGTYASLLRAVASGILDELDLGDLKDGTVPEGDLTGFVERRVLRAVAGEVAIVFDEVDRILGRPYRQDFFAMLRGWHNRRASHPDAWEKLDLALVIPTEPYLLIDRADQSPFNVVTPLSLEPLSRDQMGQLNSLHGGVLNTGELDHLHALVGGQPYLSRLALYRLNAEPRLTFSQLDERAADPEGPFGEHLRSLLLRLQGRSGLLDAMRQVVRHGTTSDDDTTHRLFRAGLTRHKGKRIVRENRA
jgi:hypothetical protein